MLNKSYCVEENISLSLSLSLSYTLHFHTPFALNFNWQWMNGYYYTHNFMLFSKYQKTEKENGKRRWKKERKCWKSKYLIVIVLYWIWNNNTNTKKKRPKRKKYIWNHSHVKVFLSTKKFLFHSFSVSALCLGCGEGWSVC